MTRSTSLPDGPPTVSRVQRLQLLFRPLASLERWAHRYGDPFCLGRTSPQPEVYFSHPEAIQRIATADPQLFEPPHGDRTLRFLLGDRALRYLAGEPHQRGRRLLSPPLHGERMVAHGQQMQAIATDVSDRWCEGRALRVRAAMQETTLRVISRAVFGREDHAGLRSLRRTLGALLDHVTRPWAILMLSLSPQRLQGRLSPWGHLARRRQVIDGFIYEEIRARRARANGPARDILDVLVSAKDADGRGLDDEEVRDEVMMLLFAGHETTASALTWALYSVHRWPEVLERLRRELATLGPGADPVAIARLPYLDAVCQETLRLYPGAVGIPKVLRGTLDVMGWQLAPGTQLVPCFYLTHRRADLYPEPTRFRPDRFLERQYSPYEFLPFGAGPRRCIGMAFAQFEMKQVLATILSRWSLRLARRAATPVRRGVFAGPPPGLRLLPIARR